jgi:S-layer protein
MALTTAQQTSLIQYTVALYGAAAGGYMAELAGYVNQGYSVAAVGQALATSASFKGQSFGLSDASTNIQFVDAFCTNLLGNNVAAATLATLKTEMVSYLDHNYLTRAHLTQIIIDKLAAVSTSDPDFGTAAQAFQNKVAVATYYTVTMSGSSTELATLQSTVASVTATSDVSSDAAMAAIVDATSAGTTGQTFTLTTGVDTITGTSGNDIFNAGTSATLSAFDNIDGGAGTDTLTAFLATAALPGSLTVKNIETATINTTDAGFVDSFTGWTGLTGLTVQSSAAGAVIVTAASTTAVTAVGADASVTTIIGGGSTANITTGAGAIVLGGTVANNFTSVTTSGGTTVAITDRSGASAATGSALKTVSITSAADDQIITANGLTTLNLTTLTGAAAVGDTTVTAAAGTRALTVNYNGVDVGGDGAATAGAFLTMTDATATTLNINAVTAKSYDVTAVVNAATAVNINAAVDLQMDALTAGLATAVAISGAGAVTITADTLAANAVVTSTNTGGVTLSQALLADQQFVGTASSGNDSIGVATAFTKAITTGAGNDTVTYGGPATGGSIDAGEGTDTIAMTAAVAATATGSTTFAGTVSNFEKLEINAATGAAAAINMANADGINSLVLNGVTADALTVTNAAANFTYTNKAAVAFASSIALASATGTSDVVNVVYTATNGFVDTAAMTIADVETINISTLDADTTAQTTKFTAGLTTAAAKTINISGDTGVELANTSTALTTVDASGLTGTVAAASGFTWTTGALAASSTIKGSAAATNTVDFSAANTASTFVTYTGGAGDDAVIGSNGLNNVVDLGNGTNAYTQTGVGNATVTGGTGADTISVGTGANTVNVGGGTTANSVTVGAAAGLNVITTTSTGVDTFVLGGIQTAAGYYSSLNGWTVGDKIDFSGVTAGVSVDAAMGAKITLGGASTFANYLDAATAGNGSVNAISNWFQLNGNTYLVIDNNATATFADGVDSVIELVGLVDLTTSATVSDVLTLA